VQWTPKRYHWTNEEFCNLGDAGVFEGRSVILVDGEILQMAMLNPPHDMSLSLTDYLLREIFRIGHFIRVQTGLAVNDDTNLGPDLAVVIGSPRDYKSAPRTAVLIVEVADTSLAYDRGEKSNLYAAAGIQDYWVIDVNGRELLIFREPIADAEAPRGYRYTSIQSLVATDSVTPLAAPEASIRVADMLP